MLSHRAAEIEALYKALPRFRQEPSPSMLYLLKHTVMEETHPLTSLAARRTSSRLQAARGSRLTLLKLSRQEGHPHALAGLPQPVLGPASTLDHAALETRHGNFRLGPRLQPDSSTDSLTTDIALQIETST
jgi:hypothetical protein